MDMNELLVKFEKMLDVKLNEKISEVKQEIAELKQNVQSIEAKLELFEYDYGTRIKLMSNAILLEEDQNTEINHKIHKLEEKVERNEFHILECQNDIFKLQQKVR